MDVGFRNFDNRDRYYDRQGNPLCGCLQFIIKDGTTAAQIFDSDRVPLANPQLTDWLGRTYHQVFVNSDVVAYVYKYIGSGTLAEEEMSGIDTSDESKWSLQYTVESVYTANKTVTGTAAMGVAEISSLRGLDVSEVPAVDGTKIVTLEGYYEAGDCEPVSYVWDPESTLDDDNGSVIHPDGVQTGRWILVPPTGHCDSRHFGVFPQDSAAAEIDQSTRIAQLISYCNTKSIRPYFNGSQAYPYFIYESVAFTSRNAIDVSDDTRFVDKGSGNRFYGEWNGNPLFVNGNTQVNSKTVRHSWHFKDYGQDTVNYIVDSQWSPVHLSDIRVKLEVSPASGSQFDDCEIESTKVIANHVVMENLDIRTDWFDDDYDWSQLSLNGCSIRLHNCKDANTYIILKNIQGEGDYGDLGEQTVSDMTLGAHCIAENALFDNVTLSGDAELHNVSGTISAVTPVSSLNVVDCWLTVNDATVLSSVQWRRGSVSSTSMQVLHSCLMENVEILGALDVRGVDAQFEGCKVRGTVVGQNTTFRNCTVLNTVTTLNDGEYIDFLFEGCVFEGYGEHSLSSTVADTQVKGAWVNCFAKERHPITVDMTNIRTNDASHTYLYEGNGGKFLPRYPRLSFMLNGFATFKEIIRHLATVPCLIDSDLVLSGIGAALVNGVWVPEDWFMPLHFFAIGSATTTLRMCVSFEFTDTTELNSDMNPKVDHIYTFEGQTVTTVLNAANYDCDAFGDKMIGNFTIGPKNATLPPPGPLSPGQQGAIAIVTLERLR